MPAIIHECTQGEGEWMRLRIGKVTASEIGNLITDTFSHRTGEMPFTYLSKKAAEAWRGSPLPGFNSWASEQGQELEYEARSWFSLQSNSIIRNVGFVEHESGICGCSPDALLDDDNGLELKAPEAHTHTKYLLNGTLPKEYGPQVHMSMYVTGRPRWTFVSYRRSFPKLVLTVERDEKICATIAEAIHNFHEKLTKALEKLRSI